MSEHWKTLDGYFTFPDFYSWVADPEQRGDNWHGVEVGVYTGQSAAFLVEQIVRWRTNGLGEYKPGNSTLDLVDLELTNHKARENLAPLEHTGIIGKFHEMSSGAASYLYENGSLDFVFIDANHEYSAIAADIDAWLPKVKKGGIIAGHDFCAWPGFGVMQAVLERFPRVEIWRGEKGMGDQQMKPHYWPVWCVHVS